MKDTVCGVCKCVVSLGDTRLVATGETAMVPLDRRPKGPTGCRIGWPRPSRFPLATTVRVCFRCEGRERPQVEVPLWRQARAAWDTPEGRELAAALRRR